MSEIRTWRRFCNYYFLLHLTEIINIGLFTPNNLISTFNIVITSLNAVSFFVSTIFIYKDGTLMQNKLIYFLS